MGFWIALAITLLAELYVLRRLRFDGVTVALVLASTLLCVHYLGYTAVEERNYDAGSHIDYILAIAQHARLPQADTCGACGHPPLYYLVAALWVQLVVHGPVPLELALQWLSLLLFFGFVVFALLIVRSCGARRSQLWVAAALIVFWPSSVINSVRVHNDSLASPLMLAALYFIAQWTGQRRARHFYLALGAAALAMLTKASGYTVATALLFFTVFPLPPKVAAREWIKRCVTALLVLATAAALATGVRDFRRPTTPCQRVLGTACDGRYVPPVPDQLSRFVTFDVVDFVRRMDTAPRDPEHDYFLNRVAKSSLFGVMPLGDDFASKRQEALGVVMSLLLLAMLGSCAFGALLLRGLQWRKVRVYFVTSAILFAFLVAFRVRAANPYHEDFRHIFPALVPFCMGYLALVMRASRASKHWRTAGFVIAAGMVISSAAFFIRAA
jgi:Dolichyl-phosphate-mannose-protein mannosyltransferase